MTTKQARNLRQSMTDAERRLWRHLRGRRLDGYKFRRQYPLHPYFADFACPDAGLVIEIDGGQHQRQIDHDRRRTRIIQQYGYRVVRFWNNEVLEDTEAVLEAIRVELEG